jgi:hypothetical protein
LKVLTLEMRRQDLTNSENESVWSSGWMRSKSFWWNHCLSVGGIRNCKQIDYKRTDTYEGQIVPLYQNDRLEEEALVLYHSHLRVCPQVGICMM